MPWPNELSRSTETDHIKEPLRSTDGKEPLLLSSVSPKLISDVMGHALLPSYLRPEA
jgi:hypothetical protein